MSARVWVVDDDRGVRFVLSTALREAGYTVDAFENGADALAALEEMGIHYSAVESKSALRAGEMQRRQRQRAGEPRAIADFLVGAHALLQCDALITFDAAFHRDYFKGLKLIQPKA